MGDSVNHSPICRKNTIFFISFAIDITYMEIYKENEPVFHTWQREKEFTQVTLRRGDSTVHFLTHKALPSQYSADTSPNPSR